MQPVPTSNGTSRALIHRHSLHHRHHNATPPTLLGVWAHPDDEAYLSAGLMAQFVQRGGRVAILTATRGEAGTDDPDAWPPARLAAERSRELSDSAAVLGIDDVHTLGYPDGGCHRFDGIDAVARHIRRVKPDLIVTFGPDGLTGHSDHRAVSRWTTAARAAARPEADLWYATVTDHFHDTWGAVNDAARFFYSGQPDTPRTPIRDLVHYATLTDELLDLKITALTAHTTQTAGLIERIGPDTYREWWRTEAFRRAPAISRYLQIADLTNVAA